MGSIRTRSTRAGALLLAATFGLLASGLNPLATASHTAYAQDERPGEEHSGDERPDWAPPPPSGGPPGDNDGQPDQRYTQDQECVTRAGELDDEIVLKNIPWGQQHLRIADVHEYVRQQHGTVGDGMTVAVIDTGVTEHPFLAGRLEGGADYVQGDDPLEDCDGHGTQVAGIIAAAHDNPDIGFQGVAPDARILSIRQSSQNYSPESDDEREQRELLEEAEEEDSDDEAGDDEAGDDGADGSSGTEPGAAPAPTAPGQDGGPRVQGEDEGAGDLTTLAQSVRLAADTDGVEVINMSVDNCRQAGPPLTAEEAQLQSAVRYAVDNDVVVVAAAGNVSDACPQNEQSNPLAPQTIVSPPWFSEDLLAVGAVDRTGGVADFSVHGPWVSVAAPGAEITSLDPADGSGQLANLTFEGGNEVPLQGTSFAAPYVAGVAVLVRQMHPELDAREVMHRIESTAQHPGARDGRDQFVGHGVVNPMAALTATVPEEAGIDRASDIAVSSDMPPRNEPSSVPVIVALAGSGGALVALGLTLFIVHTVRKKRPETAPQPRNIA